MVLRVPLTNSTQQGMIPTTVTLTLQDYRVTATTAGGVWSSAEKDGAPLVEVCSRTFGNCARHDLNSACTLHRDWVVAPGVRSSKLTTARATVKTVKMVRMLYFYLHLTGTVSI